MLLDRIILGATKMTNLFQERIVVEKENRVMIKQEENVNRSNFLFYCFLTLFVLLCSPLFGANGNFDFLTSINNAFTKIFEEQVIYIGIAVLFVWGMSLIISGVPIMKALIYVGIAGVLLGLATKAGPWFAGFANNYEANYG